MGRQTTRSFRISDAIVLIAATGLGLAGCRLWFSATETGWGDLWPSGDESVLVSLWTAAVEAIPISSILLMSWGTAVLALQLRVPRPRRGRLWCQPGLLAGLAAIFTFAWKALGIMLFAAVKLLLFGPGHLAGIDYQGWVWELAPELLSVYYGAPSQIGGAVLLIWLVTWASGRCRPEASWIDRTGRTIGAAWVGISLLAATASAMIP